MIRREFIKLVAASLTVAATGLPKKEKNDAIFGRYVDGEYTIIDRGYENICFAGERFNNGRVVEIKHISGMNSIIVINSCDVAGIQLKINNAKMDLYKLVNRKELYFQKHPHYAIDVKA